MWSADNGYSGGAVFSVAQAIANTSDQPLYQSERWSDVPLTYSFSAPAGQYTVNLKFAEIWFTSAGSRVLHIAINGVTVRSNFDIVATAGSAFRATDLSFTATSSGTITILLTPVVSTVKISAIEIVEAGTGGPALPKVRTNSGGGAYTDSVGVAWNADFGCGSGATFSTGTAIANTADPALYQSERWSSTTMQYSFNVPNGIYEVRLKFAEIWFTSPGQRRFGVLVNGQLKESSFDIVSEAGGAFRAVDRVYRTYVTNGNVTIQLVPLVSTVKISAIEVVPMPWKAITYFPRRHAYPRMLLDWKTVDAFGPNGPKEVRQMADEDLTRLAQNGFNVIHHYIWDKALLDQPLEPAGFRNPPESPRDDTEQWAALRQFVELAKSKGLFVILHFASGTLILDAKQSADPEAAAQKFANWAGEFIRQLNQDQPGTDSNLLGWGMAYAFNPPKDDPTGTWARTWQKVYRKIDDIARSYSPIPGVLGLVGSNIEYPLLRGNGDPNPFDDVIERGAGYRWAWQDAQSIAKNMRELLTESYGQPKDPDFYMFQLYHANSTDLASNLNNLINTSTPSGLQIPAEKLLVVEFATSSSLDPPPVGNQTAGFGDSNTPTTTLQGQAQWLRNTLCAFRSAGLQRTSYWAMYDPQSFWISPPWLKQGRDLAWNGYWGLASELESWGDKPAWAVLSDYYRIGSLTCPAASAAPPPIVSVLPANSYFTVGQPVVVYWTAADVLWLGVNRTHGATYSCNPQQGILSWTSLVGSCGYSSLSAYQNTGTQTVTLTGTNLVGASQSVANASASVQIGTAPKLFGIVPVPDAATIRSNDTVIIWGDGFSVSGGNYVRFARAGFTDVWLYNNGFRLFSDRSYTQITAALGGLLQPGVWSAEVYNSWPSLPSPPLTVMIEP